MSNIDKTMEIDTSFEDKKVVLLDATLSSGGVQPLASSLSTGVNLGGTNDYEKLKNKPSINGTELIGNYDEIDPTVPAWAKEPDKPEYDADEIGAVSENNIVTRSEIDLMFLKIFGN